MPIPAGLSIVDADAVLRELPGEGQGAVALQVADTLGWPVARVVTVLRALEDLGQITCRVVGDGPREWAIARWVLREDHTTLSQLGAGAPAVTVPSTVPVAPPPTGAGGGDADTEPNRLDEAA